MTVRISIEDGAQSFEVMEEQPTRYRVGVGNASLDAMVDRVVAKAKRAYTEPRDNE